MGERLEVWNADGQLERVEDGRDLAEEKDKAVRLIKKAAHDMLAETDWYIVRSAETRDAVPPDVAASRTKVRSELKALRARVRAAGSLEDLDALEWHSAIFPPTDWTAPNDS